ncbi:FAD-dependent thymidylate synthase [Bradyrhizobium japonicum]|uniref:FAD-dependent thymidylate synthase n=1 Tax=Bradyrhizobium japonicum TaxID=375 RepID=UPI0027153FE5|nr:FAD-dependent thymidylate synthase [Bradyrhizobium japonicum]WLB53798.1 FAD-dependent thymidylate synthase [Bradyrhizobium japonicum]WLB64329.1 FAD-dependent thymidylate synthase [Bradyrhizobium japonicum]
MIGKKIPVLDKGFVRVLDYMGDDGAIVQAARVSYGKGTKSVSEDAALIRYLMRHMHTTPFEMCELKLHIKLPIFVARQWVRHRTANINEYSARYSVLEREFYVPAPRDVAQQSASNRQGRGGVAAPKLAESVRRRMVKDAEQAFDTYESLLDETKPTQGVSRELARIGLPLSTYTEWYWKIDLHNLFHFLRLRADEHAQLELRKYAIEILRIVEKWVPAAFDAFLEYQMYGGHLSRSAIRTISELARGKKISYAASGLSRREWDELVKMFSLESRSG